MVNHRVAVRFYQDGRPPRISAICGADLHGQKPKLYKSWDQVRCLRCLKFRSQMDKWEQQQRRER